MAANIYKLSNENIEASLVLSSLAWPHTVPRFLYKTGDYFMTDKYRMFSEAITFIMLNDGRHSWSARYVFIDDLKVAYDCLDFPFPEWIHEEPEDILGIEYLSVTHVQINVAVLYQLDLERVNKGNSEYIQKGSFNGGLGNYYDSTLWWVLRTVKLRESHNSCSLCNAKNTTLNCHHKTYERKHAELLSDLIVLCRKCHAKHHGHDEASEKLEAIKGILAS